MMRKGYINLNPIECIWKTFQVTELSSSCEKRKSKPTFSDNSATQRFLHQNPRVKSTDTEDYRGMVS